MNRSTRSVTLTDAGRLLQLRSAPLMEMVESDAERIAGAWLTPKRPSARGRASRARANRLPGLLSEFLTLYPDVHIDLQIGNRVVDLVEEGIDIALRFGRIGDENLIVRRLQRVELILCATPSYWAKRGIPKHPMTCDGTTCSPTRYRRGRTAPSVRSRRQPYNLPIYGRMDANDSSTSRRRGTRRHRRGVCAGAAGSAVHRTRQPSPVLKEFMPRDIWL